MTRSFGTKIPFPPNEFNSSYKLRSIDASPSSPLVDVRHRYGGRQRNRPRQARRRRLCGNQRAVRRELTLLARCLSRDTLVVATRSECARMLVCVLHRMYQDKLASLKRQLQQLQEGGQVVLSLSGPCSTLAANQRRQNNSFGFFFNIRAGFAGTLQEYQKRMKKLDQQYKERLRNAGERRYEEGRLADACRRRFEVYFTTEPPPIRKEITEPDTNYRYHQPLLIHTISPPKTMTR